MIREEHSAPPQTTRKEMIELLSARPLSARDISQAMGIREKEVYDHLSHIARTSSSQHKKLIILPFECLSCGYVFEERKRFTRPGRCPRCKKSHIQIPLYRIL